MPRDKQTPGWGAKCVFVLLFRGSLGWLMRSYRPPTVAACQSKGQETSCNSNACLEVQSQWCAAASNAANILVKISQEAHRVQTGLVARGCTLCLNVADHPSPPGELLKGCPKFFRRLPLLAGFDSSVSDLRAIHLEWIRGCSILRHKAGQPCRCLRCLEPPR